MVGRLSEEVEGLLDSVITLTYYMRGAVTYSEMLNTTSGERSRIDKFVEARLDKESKSAYPVY